MGFKCVNFVFLKKQADLYQVVTFRISDYLQCVNSKMLFLLMI